MSRKIDIPAIEKQVDNEMKSFIDDLHGINVMDFCSRTGLSKSWIYMILKGRAPNISHRRMRIIQLALQRYRRTMK